MADEFKRLNPGDKLRPKARTWNTLLEVAREYRTRTAPFQGAIGTKVEDVVWIENQAEESLPFLAVVGIGRPVTIPAENESEYLSRNSFQSVAPANGENFAILQEPIDVGVIGLAKADGLTKAFINVSNVEHRFAAPVDDDYAKLASQFAKGPARIYYLDTPGDTALDGAINDSVTELVVADYASWPDAPFVVTIDDEDISVTATADETWTVTRASNGTTAASHDDESAVALKSGVVLATVMLDMNAGGGAAIGTEHHLRALCRLDDTTVTVLSHRNIPSVFQVADDTYVFAFDVDFGSKDAFTVTGMLANLDSWYEDYTQRTSHSCVLKTFSGTAPASVFGAVVHGEIEEDAEPDPEDPFNPVDPVTPTVLTPCCEGELPNAMCAQFGNLLYDDPESPPYPGYVELIEGMQIVLNITYLNGDTNSAIWTGSVVGPNYVVNVIAQCSSVTSSFTVQFEFRIFGLNFNGSFTESVSFDCDDPFSFYGSAPIAIDVGDFNGDISITLTTAPCATPPTVTASFSDLAIDATEITITGTGFDAGTPGNNIVTFNVGAGTVTAATSTTLTVEFSSPPTAGALTAIVVNGNGTSAPAVQVATVVSGGGGDGSTCADAVGLLDGVAVHPVLTAAEIRYHSLALATGISYKIDYDLAGSTTIDVFGGDCDAVFGEVGGAFGSGSITVTSHTGPKVIVIINESSGTSPNEFTVTIL